MLSTISKHTIIIMILAAGGFFSASGHIEKAAETAGAGAVSNYNQQYLESSFNKSLKGFLILSAIKSGLAVIEGSEIGVGFSLEVGDIVQSVYDYVDIAWKTALAGGTIILISQLALQVVSLINHWCLSLIFFSLLILYILDNILKKESRLSRITRNILMFMAVLTIALYLILPVSIRGASYLSERITNPLIESAQENFQSFRNDLSAEALSRRFFEDKPSRKATWFEALNIQIHYDKARQNFSELGKYLKEKTEFIALWTIRLIAGYLFDALLFPIIFFSFLYLFVKFTIHNLLGMNFFPQQRLTGT